MSELSAPFPRRFSFTYSDDELRAYQRVAGRRQDPGPDGVTFIGVTLCFIFGVGLAVAAARYADLIPPTAYKSALITAYVAFVAGWLAYYIALWVSYRRMAEIWRMYLAKAARDYEIAFSLDNITWRTSRIEATIPWSAVTEIDEKRGLVCVWTGLTYGVILPVRVFTDIADRATFVAAIRRKLTAPETKV